MGAVGVTWGPHIRPRRSPFHVKHPRLDSPTRTSTPRASVNLGACRSTTGAPTPGLSARTPSAPSSAVNPPARQRRSPAANPRVRRTQAPRRPLHPSRAGPAPASGIREFRGPPVHQGNQIGVPRSTGRLRPHVHPTPLAARPTYDDGLFDRYAGQRVHVVEFLVRRAPTSVVAVRVASGSQESASPHRSHLPAGPHRHVVLAGVHDRHQTVLARPGLASVVRRGDGAASSGDHDRADQESSSPDERHACWDDSGCDAVSPTRADPDSWGSAGRQTGRFDVLGDEIWRNPLLARAGYFAQNGSHRTGFRPISAPGSGARRLGTGWQGRPRPPSAARLPLRTPSTDAAWHADAVGHHRPASRGPSSSTPGPRASKPRPRPPRPTPP